MTQINLQQTSIDNLKEELKRDGIEKTVVGAIVVEKGKVLLLRRVAGDFMERLVELPSGTVDPGEKILHALIREVKEETGLEVTSVDKYIDSFDYASKSGKRTRQLNFRIQVSGNVKVDPSEHDAYFWTDPNSLEFESLNISEKTKKSIRKAL